MHRTLITLAILALAGCNGNSNGTTGSNPYYSIVVSQAIGTVTDVIELYADLPADAVQTLIAVRDYGEGICAVVLQGADPTTLDKPRAALDEVYANATDLARADPVIRVAVRRAVSTARMLADAALAGSADPAAFERPCNTLVSLPRVFPRS